MSRSSVILPSEQVGDLAEACLDRHVLRGADALQLAAALTWCREEPAGKPLISFDPGLGAAARAAGFDVLP